MLFRHRQVSLYQAQQLYFDNGHFYKYLEQERRRMRHKFTKETFKKSSLLQKPRNW